MASDAEIEAAAKQLYDKHTDDAGIHSNRFPSWRELSEKARAEWRAKVPAPAAPQATRPATTWLDAFKWELSDELGRLSREAADYEASANAEGRRTDADFCAGEAHAYSMASGVVVRAFEQKLADTAAPQATKKPVAWAGVDKQVWLAAQQIGEDQRKQPEWLWYKNGGFSLSFGRWSKAAGAVPYIRADLALRAAPAASRIGVTDYETRERVANLIFDRLFGPLKRGGSYHDDALLAADDILSLLAAPRAGGETGDEWRDISTAPKDGTVLILFARHVNATASVPMFGWFCSSRGWIAMSFSDQPMAKVVPSHWVPRDILPSWPASPAEQHANQGGGR